MPAKKKDAEQNLQQGYAPPQATDMERAVLGAILIDKNAFASIEEVLTAESFYEPAHQKIFAAISQLAVEDKPVDFMTVMEQLRKNGDLEAAGGMNYILDITSNIASSANAEYHARVVAQRYLERRMITLGYQMVNNALDQTKDAEETLQETESQLFMLSQTARKNEVFSAHEVLDEALTLLQKSASNPQGMTGLPTGFEQMDAMTAGWQAADFVVVAGRPAMGKTSLALSMAKNLAIDSGTPVAFSLEMSRVQLMNRIVSNVCSIEGTKILHGQLSPEEWKRLDKSVQRIDRAPLYIDDTPGLSIYDLRSKARQLVRTKNVKAIFIDYLQLMTAKGQKFSNRQEEVSNISRSLKALAKELDIPVIALSQLNRTVETREGTDGKRPLLSDLRESGAIEQDADIVIFVHRPEYFRIFTDEKGNDLHGKAIAIVAKHRKGATGDVILDFRGEFTRFSDPDPDFLPEPPTPLSF